MRYVCPDCPSLPLNSIYAYYLHNVEEHQRYEKGESIETKTLDRFEKVGMRVLKLLLDYPDTRDPKNFRLYTRYKQYYSSSHVLIYDQNNKGWMINRPGGVMKEEDLRALWKENSTVDRRRRDLQLADKEMYHKKDAPLLNKPHKCILPTKKAELQALEEERVIRERYSGQYRMDGIL